MTATKKAPAKKAAPKQPQDHKEPDAAEPFVYTAPDGRTAIFKPFGKLPAGMFRKARHLDEMEQTFMLLEAGTDEAGLELLDEMALEDMDKVFYAWAGHSGVDLPES